MAGLFVEAVHVEAGIAARAVVLAQSVVVARYAATRQDSAPWLRRKLLPGVLGIGIGLMLIALVAVK